MVHVWISNTIEEVLSGYRILRDVVLLRQFQQFFATLSFRAVYISQSAFFCEAKQRLNKLCLLPASIPPSLKPAMLTSPLLYQYSVMNRASIPINRATICRKGLKQTYTLVDVREVLRRVDSPLLEELPSAFDDLLWSHCRMAANSDVARPGALTFRRIHGLILPIHGDRIPVISLVLPQHAVLAAEPSEDDIQLLSNRILCLLGAEDLVR
jgi:hypothetical protein